MTSGSASHVDSAPDTGAWHAVFGSLDGPPEAWDSLDPAPPLFASRGWLSVMGHRLEGEHKYFISGQGAAAGVGFLGSIIDDPGITMSKNPWELLFQPCAGLRTMTAESVASQAAAAALSPRQEWFPALVLTYPGLECFGIGPGASAPDALGSAISGVVEAAQDAGVRTVAFLYVQPENQALSTALRAASFTEFPITQRANLHLPGGSFADYLTALRPHRRHNIRTVRRKLRENGVTIERLPLAEADNDLIETLVALRQQHRLKYGKAPSAESERRLLDAFRLAFGDRVMIFCARVPPRHLVGFSLVLDAGHVQHGWTCGFDYTDPRSRLTYFELCYQAPIEAAYHSAAREMSFGYGMETTKLLRGCRLDTVHGYILAVGDKARMALSQRAAAALMPISPA